MQKYLPFLQWLPNYRKDYLLKDLVAGLTVGVVLIPQGMAYAMIADLPPVYGLYASIFPLLVYVFLGTSKHLALGPVAIDSLLVAAGLGAMKLSGVDDYITMAIFLAFMVGAIQMLLGVFRMGFLVGFLSRPVISGFTSAAAFIIIFNQFKHLFGVEMQQSSHFDLLIVHVFERISETNWYDLAIGVLGILMIIGLKKWSPKIPSILLVVVLGIIAVYYLDLEAFGVEVVGKVPMGLPDFQIPDFKQENVLSIWPIALTLALVGYLEAISIGKALEEKEGEDTIDANQELIALGASNMVGSFFKSYPVTSSFSRSAINWETGVKSNMSALFTVALIVLTLLFLTPLFYFLPKAVLASIIMVAVFKLIDFSYAKELFTGRKDEFVLLLVTFAITLFIGIPQGILIGVLFSLLLMVYRTSKPHFAVLGNVEGSDYYKNIERFGDEVIVRNDLLIVRFDAQLYFGNAAYFKKQLLSFINEKECDLKGVILNAEAINYIDSSASRMLAKLIADLQKRGLGFYISGAIGPTRDTIFRSNIINELKKEHLFVSTKEAVAYFDDPECLSNIQRKVAHQNRTNCE